jgi:hypothetical protein
MSGACSTYGGEERMVFGSKRNEVIGEWRRLYSEELHDLYCSQTLVIKSRGMR